MPPLPGQIPNPNGVGGFKAGVASNPGGRPAIDPYNMRLFKRKFPRAAEIIFALLDDPDAPKALRFQAAVYCIDRVMGRTPQAVSIVREEMKERSDEELLAVLSRVEEEGQEVFKPAPYDGDDQQGDMFG
jgi:hypothetical protein